LRSADILLVASAGSLVCASCDGLPGTGSYREEKAKRSVSEQLLDPTSAQFRNVQSRGDSVCGEVNAKNKIGAYVGFRRFVVDTATYSAVIDPQFDLTDLLSARDLCTEVSSNEYSSASTTMSACGRVAELEATQIQQESFDSRWTKQCEGFVGREVYRPPLQSGTPEDEQNAAINETPTDAQPEQSASEEATAETDANEHPSNSTNEDNSAAQPDEAETANNIT
jgi:hypothetical protein